MLEIHNRWIVPYNSLLSCTFKAHINVEFANSVKNIKYVVTGGSTQDLGTKRLVYIICIVLSNIQYCKTVGHKVFQISGCLGHF